MRELFSRPVQWGTLDEMKEMLEDALTTAIQQRSSDEQV
jgi:hypothetical protein